MCSCQVSAETLKTLISLKLVLLVPRQSKSGYCGLCVVYTCRLDVESVVGT